MTSSRLDRIVCYGEGQMSGFSWVQDSAAQDVAVVALEAK